jgi:hypothetical protein
MFSVGFSLSLVAVTDAPHKCPLRVRVYANRSKVGIKPSVFTSSHPTRTVKLFVLHSVGKLKHQVRGHFVDFPVVVHCAVHWVMHRKSEVAHSRATVIHRGCG